MAPCESLAPQHAGARHLPGEVGIWILVCATILCGFCFACVKMYEYHSKLTQELTPATNDFFMLYYVAAP